MRVFVTGATGFIGSTLVKELIGAGYQVLGLSRSDAGAKALAAAGAEVHRGDLEDLESLRSGAAKSDGVIHLAFNHDFSKYVENCEADRRAIEALGSALVGSERPLIVTSGTLRNASVAPGRLGTEEDAGVPSSVMPRGATEEAAASLAARGVRILVVRLPQVHDRFKQGLNRWPAAHLVDTAHLYRLVLEKGAAGARYHAVAEEGVSAKDIAEAIGRRLKLPVVSKRPEEAVEHFGWFGPFMSLDSPCSSALTRERLGWQPRGPGLISDLDNLEI